MALLSYQLATIKTDVELDLTSEQLTVNEPAVEELLGLFREYEFKRWITDLEEGKWLQGKRVILPRRKRWLNRLKNRSKPPVRSLPKVTSLFWMKRPSKAG